MSKHSQTLYEVSKECSRECYNIIENIFYKDSENIVVCKKPLEIIEIIITQITSIKNISYSTFAENYFFPESMIYRTMTQRVVRLKMKYAVQFAALYPRCTVGKSTACARLAVYLLTRLGYDKKQKVGNKTLEEIICDSFDAKAQGYRVYVDTERSAYVKKQLEQSTETDKYLDRFFETKYKNNRIF